MENTQEILSKTKSKFSTQYVNDSKVHFLYFINFYCRIVYL